MQATRHDGYTVFFDIDGVLGDFDRHLDAHGLRGDTGHRYDATSRVLQTSHLSLGGIQNPLAQAANESFGYDPAGNIQDAATQQAVQSSTALSQRGYVRDNLVRVFEDKRYFYDGHGRLTRKLAGRSAQSRTAPRPPPFFAARAPPHPAGHGPPESAH